MRGASRPELEQPARLEETSDDQKAAVREVSSVFQEEGSAHGPETESGNVRDTRRCPQARARRPVLQAALSCRGTLTGPAERCNVWRRKQVTLSERSHHDGEHPRDLRDRRPGHRVSPPRRQAASRATLQAAGYRTLSADGRTARGRLVSG